MRCWRRAAWLPGELGKSWEEWVGAYFKVGNLTWSSQGVHNGLNLVRGSKEGDIEIWAVEVTEEEE